MRGDATRILEAKILSVLTGGGASGVTTGGVAAGTSADPNSLGLASTVLVYSQFDGGGNLVATFYRNQNGIFV